MRDLLYSEITNVHGIPSIPRGPGLTIEAGRQLCQLLIEPPQITFEAVGGQ